MLRTPSFVLNGFKHLKNNLLIGNVRLIHLNSFRMSDEVEKAQTAKRGEDTIFGKIIRKEIPCELIYEDDVCIAINDINPVAPVHFLIITKKPIQTLSDCENNDKDILGHLFIVARKLAKQKKIDQDGYRTIINNGKHGCQSIYHLHVHVLGGKQLKWDIH